jgi:hypothetical protein
MSFFAYQIDTENGPGYTGDHRDHLPQSLRSCHHIYMTNAALRKESSESYVVTYEKWRRLENIIPKNGFARSREEVAFRFLPTDTMIDVRLIDTADVLSLKTRVGVHFHVTIIDVPSATSKINIITYYRQHTHLKGDLFG